MHGNEIQIEPGFFFGQMLSVLGGLFLVSVGAAILYSIAYWRLHGRPSKASSSGYAGAEHISTAFFGMRCRVAGGARPRRCREAPA